MTSERQHGRQRLAPSPDISLFLFSVLMIPTLFPKFPNLGRSSF